jgi:molybdopterin-guanine dinucleotide biosynthesis protein A
MATPPDARLAAAILTGGLASRYGGASKGLLRLPDGTTILSRAVAALRNAGLHRILLVANDQAPYRDLGLAMTSDDQPGCGPLGGIVTALRYWAGQAEGVLFLPCDLPALTASEVAALAAAFDPPRIPLAAARTADGRWHPLCSVVHVERVATLTEALERGERSVWRLWEQLGAAPVPFTSDAPFYNVNTPDDLAEWVRRTTPGAGSVAHGDHLGRVRGP